MLKRFSIAALLIGSVCLAGISHADTATFNYAESTGPNAPLGDPGTSFTYTANENAAYTVKAYGFTTSNGTASDLYTKLDGANENGLGMNTDLGGEHEIDVNHFVQLDMTRLQNLGFTAFTFLIGSGQNHEGFAIYGSNTLGVEGTKITQDNNPTGETAATGLSYTVSLKASYKYYSVTAVNGDGNTPKANILIENGSFAVTPEGQSFALLASGLLPIGIILRRRANRA